MDYDPRFSPPSRDWHPDMDRSRAIRGRFSDFEHRDMPGGRQPVSPVYGPTNALGFTEHYGKKGPDNYYQADYYDNNWLRHTAAVARREMPGSDLRARENTAEPYGRARFDTGSPVLIGAALVILFVFLFAQISFIIVAAHIIFNAPGTISAAKISSAA
jgi:hypothetical protein